jgi:transcriptional regulator with XRE-family HTH domain
VNAGEVLAHARQRHGLSQRQLAARARTSQAAISRIERGVVSPTVETLATLLDLLGEDLVLESREIDYGHDRALLRQNLRRDVARRLDYATDVANFVLRNRGTAA